MAAYFLLRRGALVLTGSKGLAVNEPLDVHGGVADGGHLGLEVGAGALDDVDIPQGMGELGGFNGLLLLGGLRHVVGPLDGAQHDHLRFGFGSVGGEEGLGSGRGGTGAMRNTLKLLRESVFDEIVHLLLLDVVTVAS